MTWEEIHQPIFQTEEMKNLKAFIKKERETKMILPGPADVMNAFKLTPYEKVRWVIIGQDPYPDRTFSHGLSFSSLGPSTPGSLMNIFKEITRSLYVDWPDTEWSQLFKHNNLTKWAEQGILLLNTILTVEEGKPLSHQGKGWENFTSHILTSLNKHPRPLVFMFWGKQAQIWMNHVTDPKHLKLCTSHPSNKSVDYGFKGCNHFIEAMRFIRNDYFDLRPFITYEKLVPNLCMYGKQNNVTFDPEQISRLPLFTMLRDVPNETVIDLTLG